MIRIIETLTRYWNKLPREYYCLPTAGFQGTAVQCWWPGLRMILAIQAAGLLVACQPMGEPDLYARYADHPVFRLAGVDTASTALQEAEAAYLARDYERAYTLVVQLPDSTRQTAVVQLVRGIAALETERYGEAQLLFRGLSHEQGSLRDYGAWYEALTMLKAGNGATARELLRTLAVSDPGLQERIQNLSSDLE
jgi:hypothetical protein